MARMGFLESGSPEETTAIMARLLEELKRETETKAMLEVIQEQVGVRFTAGGLLLLLIPTVEAAELQQMRSEMRGSLRRKIDTGPDVDLRTVRRSLAALATEARDNPSVADANLVAENTAIPARTSLSVLKAFRKAWCNIPPFCDSK